MQTMASYEIEFDDHEVRLLRKELLRRPEVTRLAWGEVDQVEARRATAAGPAELIFYRADGPVLTVAAGQRGFDALRAALPALLSRADEAWWPALNAAPLQERRYLVWDRP
ncbi:hypothetical protein [Caulobacter sp. 17J80-11]|uniref:hypothetical protein n=1 Tax=Caulobacter sp. 17J80-11 TaxID=2763502 RepID=UPI0016538C23|nr:hypothetical protein [Caulobacter sp. 17J80-11]MBC6982614.1 hypothetical protein [Caulobacter sp. 17J80-11]